MGGGSSKKGGKLPPVLSLDHFELERILGEGGFGKVKAAYFKPNSPFSPPVAAAKKGHEPPIRWYAIKQITKKKALRSLDEVMLELRLLQDVKHPFLCNAHHAFQDPHYLYLVMDCALGGDLSYHLNKSKGGLGTKQVVFYTMQLAIALDYLHGRKILHRDLKPGNVLLLETGFVKLTDMGICGRLVDGVCGDGSGTVGYMCPQRHIGDGVHGPPSDWFSLGVMMHQLLCGSRPYKKTDFSDKNRAEIRAGKHPFPTPHIEPKLKKKCPAGLIEFMEGLMKVDVESRIKTLDEIKAHTFFQPPEIEWRWDVNIFMSYAAPFVPPSSSNIKMNNEELISGIGCEEEKMDMTPFIIDEKDQVNFVDYELNDKIIKKQSVRTPLSPASIRSMKGAVSKRLSVRSESPGTSPQGSKR